MDGACRQKRAGVGLQLKAQTRERIKQPIQLCFPTSNNEIEYEAILVGIDLAKSISSEKLIIRSDSQLVVGQVNGEYETSDQCMVRYASLFKQQLRSFVAWKLEHILRDLNEKADAFVVVAASIMIRETVFLPIYYQQASPITTDLVSQIDEVCYSWITLIMHYLSSRELADNRIEAHKI